MLDPIPTKLLKEMLPEVIDPRLNIINSSLLLGYVAKTFKLDMIKLLVKKTQLDTTELQANLESAFSVKDTGKNSILTTVFLS